LVNDLTGDRAKRFFAFDQFPRGSPIADEFLGERKILSALSTGGEGSKVNASPEYLSA
jgi:hypothetical protein